MNGPRALPESRARGLLPEKFPRNRLYMPPRYGKMDTIQNKGAKPWNFGYFAIF